MTVLARISEKARLNDGAAVRRAALTPEQRELRDLTDERCRRMQRVGVPPPSSGVIGGKSKKAA